MVLLPHRRARRPSIFAGRGGEGWGSPLRGKMILPKTLTILSKHRLGCWNPDTTPCFTAGPDPAGPGDWPLPSAGETTDPPTCVPDPLPTASADAQSCPYLDTSWQGDPGTRAQTQLHLTVRAHHTWCHRRGSSQRSCC